jgi:hypothetical protein
VMGGLFGSRRYQCLSRYLTAGGVVWIGPGLSAAHVLMEEATLGSLQDNL